MKINHNNSLGIRERITMSALMLALGAAAVTTVVYANRLKTNITTLPAIPVCETLQGSWGPSDGIDAKYFATKFGLGSVFEPQINNGTTGFAICDSSQPLAPNSPAFIPLGDHIGTVKDMIVNGTCYSAGVIGKLPNSDPIIEAVCLGSRT